MQSLKGAGGSMRFSFFAYSKFTPILHAVRRAKPVTTVL